LGRVDAEGEAANPIASCIKFQKFGTVGRATTRLSSPKSVSAENRSAQWPTLRYNKIKVSILDQIGRLRPTAPLNLEP